MRNSQEGKEPTEGDSRKGMMWLFDQNHPSPGAFQVTQWLRICLPMQEMKETGVRSLGWKDCLEEEMATHSSWEKSYGQRSMAGYSLWSPTESDAGRTRLSH